VYPQTSFAGLKCHCTVLLAVYQYDAKCCLIGKISKCTEKPICVWGAIQLPVTLKHRVNLQLSRHEPKNGVVRNCRRLFDADELSKL
jgi:hypothetical protein